MDTFQYKIMEDILLDPKQELTKEQFNTYAEYLMPPIYHVVPIDNTIQKKLFHKVAQSQLVRSNIVEEFMARMLSKGW